MALLNSLLLLPLLLLVRFFFPGIQFPSQSMVVASSPPAPLISAESSISQKQTWKDLKTKLDDVDVPLLVATSAEDHRLFNQTLNNILVPRLPGTASHGKVRSFITDYLQDLGWETEENSFKDQTPMGEKTFTNLIGTLNPRACKRVVLSCHYDSKYFPHFDFLAATDSAVPCAMILELIRLLDAKLKAHKNNDLTLQVIFFDGEEAWKDWSATDSLYGSRHLATRMSTKPFYRSECSGQVDSAHMTTEINRIEMFVLLDLIGEANPQFCNHFPATSKAFERLTKIEKKLNTLKLIESRRRSGTVYFPARCRYGGGVEDDHIPFLENGVPILHLISTPFPANWHSAGDNGDNLHHPTINNLMKILRLFLIETLNLSKS